MEGLRWVGGVVLAKTLEMFAGRLSVRSIQNLYQPRRVCQSCRKKMIFGERTPKSWRGAATNTVRQAQQDKTRCEFFARTVNRIDLVSVYWLLGCTAVGSFDG